MKREVWPDQMKFLAVIMVILWHLPYSIPGLNGLYAPVVMPLFFLFRDTTVEIIWQTYLKE